MERVLAGSWAIGAVSGDTETETETKTKSTISMFLMGLNNSPVDSECGSFLA